MSMKLKLKSLSKLSTRTKVILVVLAFIILAAQVSVLRVGKLNNIRYCNDASFAGTTAGAKIIACIADLPSTGGTADARGLEGAQTIAATITITKSVKLLLGAATLNCTMSGTCIQLNGAGSSIEGLGPTTSILWASGAGTIGVGMGADHTSVRNITLRGPNTASVGFAGVNGGAVSFVTIQGNVIEKWGDHCINTGGGATNWKVVNNLIQLCKSNGILIGGALGAISTDNLVEGNTFLSVVANSIDMNAQRNLIKNNTIRLGGGAGGAVDQWGILVQSLTNVNADYNTITGNVISANGSQGIIVRATAGQTANYTSIVANTVTGSVGGNGDGFALDGTAGGTIAGTSLIGNISQGNAEHGYLINGASTGLIRGTTVTANIASGNIGTGFYITGAQAWDTDASENISLGNGTQVDISGSIRTVMVGTKVNATAFGYTLGQDIAGGTNNFVMRDNTAGANRLIINSTGEVNIVSAFTVGSGGDISGLWTGSVAIDFANTAAQSNTNVTLAVTGVTNQDMCILGVDAADELTGTIFDCKVYAANTVTIRFNNYSVGAINPANATFKVVIIHF